MTPGKSPLILDMSQVQDSRAFTTKYHGKVNRILTEVHITAAYDPASPPTNPVHYTTQALWDTGATHSVITTKTANALGLIATGSKIVRHAGGSGSFNTHVVHFFLPNKVAIVVDEIQRIQRNAKTVVLPPKIGRNSLCSCGSGKKFNKCHGQVP